MKKEDNQEEKIFSVSDYIKILNEGLKGFRAKISGEVSEVQISAKGHVYFSLKDEEDGSVIKCIIWKYNYFFYGVKIKEGFKVIVSGKPQVYSPTGRLSFIAEVIEYAGEGLLKKEYERLKKKLSEEGIFEEERKREIPFLPQKIGIITSLKGAVIADFSNNLSKFGFKVEMIDCRVEGQEAAKELLASVKTFKERDIDLMVIIRGGGSLESMMAFNNELLVREISDFPVPVISGIGHHKDVPLMALASDISVSTPTAAANIINRSWEEAAVSLKNHQEDILNSYESCLEKSQNLLENSAEAIKKVKDLIFEKYREIETALAISFQGFKNILYNEKKNLKESWGKIVFNFNSSISSLNQSLNHSEKIIYLRNPKTQLKMGYSIVKNKERLIRSIKDAKIGEELDVFVFDGKIVSKIKNILKNERKK
jgi:exodeoxyribonuclease VII large subunit